MTEPTPSTPSTPSTARPRGFIARLVLGATIINALANALFGLVLFGGEQVPWQGGWSLGVDLALGVTIVSVLSALAAIPRVTRGAEAGLLAGLPATSLWSMWPGGRWGLAMCAGIVAMLPLLALVPMFEALAPDGLAGLAAAGFKGVTCAAGGALAILIASRRALVGAPDRTRELAAVLAKPPLGVPLESLDKGCLACTDRARGVSVVPTWHLVLEGDIDDALLEASLAMLARRYPSLGLRIAAVDGLPEYARDFRWVDGPPAPLEKLDDPAVTLEQATLRSFARHIDLFVEPAVVFTRLRVDGRLHLFVQQHHAIADGRAFFGLLSDWAAIVAHLHPDARAPLPFPADEIVGRRREAEAIAVSPRELARLRRRGFWRFLREDLALKLRPLPRMPWNVGRDYTGDNRVVRAVIPKARLEALRPWRERAGASLNSLLTGAYLRAIQAFAQARGLRADRLVAEVIVETRPREGGFASFANHLSAYLAELRGPALTSLESAARAVQAAVGRESAKKAHLERAVFRGWGVGVVTIDILRRVVFDDAPVRAQVGFSNLIPLVLPDIAGPGFRVTDLWITTPAAPPHGIALTATCYAGRVSFNFNYKASVIERAEVEALARAFVAELDAVSSGGVGAELVADD